jgi:hypothetical protein
VADNFFQGIKTIATVGRTAYKQPVTTGDNLTLPKPIEQQQNTNNFLKTG